VSDEKVAVAFINKGWGIKGEIIAQPLTDFPQRLMKLKGIHVSGVRLELDLKIEYIKKHSGRFIIKFEGINDRDEAGRLRNSYIQIDKAEVYKLPAGHYYEFELVGLEVVDSDNQVIGKIDEVLEYPACDIFVVRSEKGKILIPGIKRIVRKVDLKNRRMEVKLLPGMEFEAE
jgi:16S rRNA processing protein RimM